VPVQLALSAEVSELSERAGRLAAACAAAGVDGQAVTSAATVGGGGAPGVTLPSAALSLPAGLAPGLRAGPEARHGRAAAVVGRIENGRLLLDLRAVPPADDDRLAAAVIAAAAGQVSHDDPGRRDDHGEDFGRPSAAKSSGT
jgi:L-seryl-tRNA(Ser) seleniumtransferase